MKDIILAYMRSHVQENLRPGSNWQVNRMALASNCANALHFPEWLDDAGHPVWTIADDVADWYEEAELCRC